MRATTRRFATALLAVALQGSVLQAGDAYAGRARAPIGGIFVPPFLRLHWAPPRVHIPRPPRPKSQPDFCAPFRRAAQAPRGDLRWALPPRMALRQGMTYAVTFQLAAAKGKPVEAFTVQPDTRGAPRTANSFLFLACAGYYTGASLDRVIAGRLVEGGTPPGPPGPGYGFPQDAVHGSYGRGTVAMVDDGSPTDGGRFFILLDRMPLPPLYVILGTVSAGLPALDRVSRTPTGMQPDAQEQTAPLVPLRIVAVTVVAR